MNDDYGYYGSGSEGYAHYTAASGEDTDKNHNKGNRSPKNSGSGFIGCCCIVIIIVILGLVLAAIG